MSKPDFSRLHGLIIGIDSYQSAEHEDLSGSVADATSILNYFTQELRVPRKQLLCLLNEAATRNGIIDAFRTHLIANPNIRPLDPIVIYFAGMRGTELASQLALIERAGHGSQVDAPAKWHSSDGKCEMILPHDASGSDQRWNRFVSNMTEDQYKAAIQAIPAEKREDFIHGISDRLLSALVHKLSKVKGDNIVSSIIWTK